MADTVGERSQLRARRFDSGGETLAEAGESALLARLVTAASGPLRSERLAGCADDGEVDEIAADGHLLLGPGDDAAIWRPAPGRDVVVSQDVLVEGVDFRRPWITPYQLGRRALAVAMSDLAGMGARPALGLAGLCAPAATQLDDILALQQGMLALAAETGCSLAGGDVSDTTGPVVIDVSVIGTVRPGMALCRAAGRPGDLLMVTGVLGRAAAGLRLLQEPAPPAAAEADTSVWREAQWEPAARLPEGEALVEAGVRCGGDLSDGLIADAERTAAASGCAAEIWLDAVPTDESLRTVFPDRWMELALGGGEDFELLAAASPARAEEVRAGWPARLARLSVVGRLAPGSGVTVRRSRDGGVLPHPPVASRHYS